MITLTWSPGTGNATLLADLCLYPSSPTAGAVRTGMPVDTPLSRPVTRRGTGTPPGPETWHRYSSADRCSFGNDNMHERFHADDHRWAGVSSAEWLRRSQQENG